MLRTRTPVKGATYILALLLFFPTVPALGKRAECPLLGEVIGTSAFHKSYGAELSALRREIRHWLKLPEHRRNGYLRHLKELDTLELLLTLNFIAALHYKSYDNTAVINVLRELWFTSIYRVKFFPHASRAERAFPQLVNGINVATPQEVEGGIPRGFNAAFDFLEVDVRPGQLRIGMVGEIKSGKRIGAMGQVHGILFRMREKGLQIHRQFFLPEQIFMKNPQGDWVPITTLKKVMQHQNGTGEARLQTNAQMVLLHTWDVTEVPEPVYKVVRLLGELTIYEYHPRDAYRRFVYRDDKKSFEAAIGALRGFFAQHASVRQLIDRLAIKYEPSFHPQNFRFPNGHLP